MGDFLLCLGTLDGDAFVGLAEYFWGGGRIRVIQESLVGIEVVDQRADQYLFVVAVDLGSSIAVLSTKVYERAVPVLCHVFCSDSTDLFDKPGPVSSFSLDKGENGEVLFDSPVALADVGT